MPKKLGRPCSYTEEIAEEILGRIMDGESLRTICKDDHMPDARTVYRWLASKEHEQFCQRYVCAREIQADGYAEEIVDISDEMCITTKAPPGVKPDDEDEGTVEVVFDATAVARNRLRVDSRKWIASKLLPKKYGDKQQIEHSGTLSIADELRAAKARRQQGADAGEG